MGGQVQILEINKDSLFEKFSNTLLKQADLLYLKEKFAIESNYNQSKAFHAHLMKEVMCTDDCEIIKFLNKKLRGALKDENIEIVNLPELKTKYRDINNYYTYNNNSNWTPQVEW
jgi:hypothetical protein